MKPLDTFSHLNATTALLSLLPVTLGTLFLYRINSRKKNDEVNQIPISPLTTIGFMKLRLKPDFPLRCLDMMRKMNSPVFRLKLAIFDGIITNDIHLIRQVLKDKDSYKDAGMYQMLRVTHNGGDDIVTSATDGLFWKHSRKTMAHAFSSNHLKRMTESVKKITENFIKNRLDPMIEKGEVLDICKEMLDLTLSAICEAAFEYDMSDDEKEVLVNGFNLTINEGIKGFIFPLRSRFGKYFLPQAKDAHLASLRLIDLGTRILSSYRALDDPTKGTVIHQIAQNTNYKSDKERVNDILILLFAGHETTAYSLSWMLLELAKKPHEQEMLRKELRNCPAEDRRNLPMLRNVVKEGLRLHPVAPLLDRVTGKDILYKPEGQSKAFLIPKGSLVTCSNILLGRNEKYFKDPDKFIPSRWNDASDDAMAAVIPFTLGKRNCIGQSLAMIEMHVVLARLCTDYHFSVKEEGSPSFHISWKPAGAQLVPKKCNDINNLG